MFFTDKIFIVSGLNDDLLTASKSIVCDYLNIFASCGIESVISAPTREEYLSHNLVISCIDHINIRNSGVPVIPVVIQHKLADHYFLACRISFGIISEDILGQPNKVNIVNIDNIDRLISAHNCDEFIEYVDYQYAHFKLVDTFSKFRVISTKPLT